MKRLESLDALRGFDMLFIMGGSSLIAALAALFPDNTVWQWAGEQMRHAEWEGLTHHDTIFPLFLFIAGTAWPFSLARQREKGFSQKDIIYKILRRGFMLIFLGWLYNGLLDFHLDTLRLCSVLSRIGMGWMLGALIYLSVKKERTLWYIIAFILLGYWAVMAGIPSPDAPAGTDIFSKEGSIACYLDKVILGPHSYKSNYDPEGLLSTIPAVATALLGMMAGQKLKEGKESPAKKALALAVAGFGLAGLAWAWHFLFPINKALWSSSFVCATASYSLLMLAFFYYVIDVKGWKHWDKFFVVIGMNSITIYMAQRFHLLDGLQHKLFDGLIALCPDTWQHSAEEVSWIAICWLFLYLLYRNKIFLKI